MPKRYINFLDFFLLSFEAACRRQNSFFSILFIHQQLEYYRCFRRVFFGYFFTHPSDLRSLSFVRKFHEIKNIFAASS